MSDPDGPAQPLDPRSDAASGEPENPATSGLDDPTLPDPVPGADQAPGADAGPSGGEPGSADTALGASPSPSDAAGAPPDASGDLPAPQPVPHAGLRYAVLRIAMLVTVGGVLALVGMRGWLLLLTAVLVSAVLSFFVFARQREAAARNLEASLARRRAQDATWRAAAEGSRSGPQAPVTDGGQDAGPQR